jgi:hypothetical protein
MQTPPETYIAYDPSNINGSTIIRPGGTAIIQNQETGQYCRMAPLPQSTTQIGAFEPPEGCLRCPSAFAGWRAASPRPERSAQVPRSALPKFAQLAGMVCDQATPDTASVMTYTGVGLSYDNMPLVSDGPGLPLVLQNTSTNPAADIFQRFPPVAREQLPALRILLCQLRVPP